MDAHAAAQGGQGEHAAEELPSRVSFSLQEEPQAQQEKIIRILAACKAQDLNLLAQLATSDGGLVNDAVRRTACTLSLLALRRPLPPQC